ncbi:MAG: hypothetical protein HQK73_11260 [Desulfamplus sp.]|nr:hypothetical protein [Desulfamplus sp.]
MATFAGTQFDDFIVPTTDNVTYRGGAGNDTYILTNLINSNAVIVIADTEGNNKIQLADGLSIISSVFYNDATELTLSNSAKIQILGASRFSFEIGANASAGDIALNPNATYAQFAADFGVATLPTTGSTPGSSYTIPNKIIKSIDYSAIQSAAATYDASTDSFKFIEDPTKANNVEISGFSSDDVIEVTQTPDADYLFSSEDNNAVISLNMSGVVSSITLVGVLSGDVVIDGSYESFQQAVRADAFTFA